MFGSNTSAVSADANYIEDVFSTYLYTGNGSSQTITNGIDLAGKGGLTWVKSRQASSTGHVLVDTARGAGYVLESELTSAQYNTGYGVTAFSSSGFSVKDNSSGSGYVNGAPGGTYAGANAQYVSWTFRKQPKFFDVVTYTGNGNGAGQTINHNLGSVPGFIVCKSTSATGDWAVCARTGAGTYATGLSLNSTAAALYSGSLGAAPTATTFSTAGIFDAASGGTYPNVNGVTYVAYLFAHDAGGFGLSGTDNVISCGSFTTDGSGNATVNLGWEPQWVLRKASSTTSNWFIGDSMRGQTVSNENSLEPNLSLQELSDTSTYVTPTSTGFTLTGGGYTPNATYIYIAIRRGPMKVPTDGTKVFSPNKWSSSTGSAITTNFPVDAQISKYMTGTDSNIITDRLRGLNASTTNSSQPILRTNNTDSEIGNSSMNYNYSNVGFLVGGNYTGSGWALNFRRAPGFFDVVCYTGTGVARTVNHNLGVAPEMIIVKPRATAPDSNDWKVYDVVLGVQKEIYLNNTSAATGPYSPGSWGNTTPTATTFSVSGSGWGTNASGINYIAYLFASCPGVSKVGSYTGTGTTQQINCGFTAGARFVLIKATSTTGDWLVWDSARGIVAGNDPYLALNSTAAEVTTTDWVDAYSAGFELSNASGNLANTNGVSYIFLSVA